MKIVLTGGGTGGHFYPLIAVAEEVQRIAKEKKLLTPQLYFMSPHPYDEGILYEHGIRFIKIPGGKVRQYFSIRNFFDVFVTAYGVIKALWDMLVLYPDAVFSKGGYGSFPTLIAARFYRIPIIVHESDTVPGKVNLWSGKIAYRIAVSYPEAAQYFPKDKVAVLGNPVRPSISIASKDTGKEYFGIPAARKTVLVLGGSQGAKIINEAILEALPDLAKEYSVIHQTGTANFEEIKNTSSVVVSDPSILANYKPFPNLDPLHLKMAAGAADVIITRAGSTLFEIALWETPAIVIPITKSNGDHQKKNAFAYARAGAGLVIEENNLTPHVLVSEVRRIVETPAISDSMKAAAKSFAKPDAAAKVAEALLAIGLTHETE
ncbi:MAG TPA: UDP-N-acetylglucosamine--N-acetylmuramyl-(pentapeptide) pyrophosphoryl-undecaprenol N-acetylglucosamine transferase [Candidatus Paceibacterota bacterium]|nr:UDP-N-acetylglucosamine--N-acetylmuramyl-(pentapeptide) pyrophosphoryl-undecaprenol N-acetylglucosamine transferase [Candidatus Paceibacterota bacterium]